jgi:D-alanyl-D-alanine dipeptidase
MRLRISAFFKPWLRERPSSLVCLILLLGAAMAAPTAQDSLSPDWDRVLVDMGLVDVQTICPDILVELKYATEDNFLHKNVYGDLKKCFLLKEAALKLAVAQKNLATLKPGWRLKIYDGARPRRIQATMGALVKGTPRQPFVANPKTGSNHNYGAAVDLTLVDEKGLELDMGTTFDFFGDLAQPRLEDAFLKKGVLTANQVQNRRLLRKVMTEAGFISISSEWWHFDAFPIDEVRRRFNLIE